MRNIFPISKMKTGIVFLQGNSKPYFKAKIALKSKAFTNAGRVLKCALIVTMVCLATSSASSAIAQTVNWRVKRASLERQFGSDLQDIANWSRANGIPQQVEQTFKIHMKRDLGRQYIFMPDERGAPVAPAAAAPILKEWFNKVNAAKAAHADRIFDLARVAADQKAGAVALQFVFDALHYNRGHVRARQTLGHRKKEKGGWRVASDSLRVKQTKQDHDVVKWGKGEYIKVLTPHFEIESNASEEKTRYLAEKLERWHLVWSQVFFEYWSSSEAIKKWIGGGGSLRMSSKKFRVVFFRDRAEYVNQLEPLVRGIKVSSGYYSGDQRISFFYDGDEKVQDTWRHELTHQLFRESGGAKGDNLEKQFIWLDEGIATYFESLKEFDGYVTLGGFDASRIQYARIRKLLENFHIDVKELSTLGRSDLQKRTDIKRIYSEAAGLTDMLVNDRNGADEQKLTEFLRLMYKGKLKPGTFSKVMGKTFKQLDDRYAEYLIVDSTTVENQIAKPNEITELSVPAADLRTLAFESIGECTNLSWLDLSRNDVTLNQFEKLASCTKINQLILTECRFAQNSLRGLEFFPVLDDLDLSGSSVQDAQLVSFQRLKSLKSLRLTATAITDTGLLQLVNVPNLNSVDVSGTRVTANGIANLQARRPGIQISR